MTGNIFISYRRDESSHVAGRLHERLAQTFGRDNIFMDVDNIPPGVDFVTHLNNKVAACDVMLAVIGPTWLMAKNKAGKRRLYQSKDFVAIEVGAALARDIRVIPVLVDGARMPQASELPDALKPLARRQAVEVRHEHFGKDAEALLARMRGSRWRRLGALAAGAAVALLLVGVGVYQYFGPGKPQERTKAAVETQAADKVPNLGQAITKLHLIEVRDVKRILQNLGMYTGAINNEADEAYYLAVSKFQQSRNIVSDGLVGLETLTKLREAWPEFFGEKKIDAPSQQAPTVARDQNPQPGLTPSERYGIHLITSTSFQVAEENAAKAKSVVPGHKILLYKRVNGWWAPVVIYTNNLTASADLSQYTKNPDWADAQVVTLESWCEKATGIEVQRTSSEGGNVFVVDCHKGFSQ
jgi:TIR domain/Putative peptidoglycan binding domain